MKWLVGLASLLLAIAAGVALYHVVLGVYHGQAADAGEASVVIGSLESSFLYWFGGTGIIATIGLTAGLSLLLPTTLRVPDWTIALIPLSVVAQAAVRFYVMHGEWAVPAILGGLSLWLASEIARLLYGDSAAALTRVLLCAAPFLILSRVTTGAPTACGILAVIYYTLLYRRDKRALWAVGCFFGAALAMFFGASTLGFSGPIAACMKLMRLNYWLLGWPLSLLLVFVAPLVRSTAWLLAGAAVLLAVFAGPSDFAAAAWLLGILAAAGLARINRPPLTIAIVLVNLAMFWPLQIYSLRTPQ